ncbi:MAG: peptidylprolyl isomerase [Phycisphaerales bacterium]
METSKGDIILELNNDKAPISTGNFMKYVDDGFYAGTIFHRVINNFMIQGGGFGTDLKQKSPTYPAIKNEWKNGLKNTRGTIAMARTNVADSATSQFFINVKDNASLDQPNDGAAYAVFGRVISGMDVVDKIKVVRTGNKGGMGNVPIDTVEIKSAKRLTADEARKYTSAGDSPASGGDKKPQ